LRTHGRGPRHHGILWCGEDNPSQPPQWHSRRQGQRGGQGGHPQQRNKARLCNVLKLQVCCTCLRLRLRFEPHVGCTRPYNGGADLPALQCSFHVVHLEFVTLTIKPNSNYLALSRFSGLLLVSHLDACSFACHALSCISILPIDYFRMAHV
jgi:hypothetical protein